MKLLLFIRDQHGPSNIEFVGFENSKLFEIFKTSNIQDHHHNLKMKLLAIVMGCFLLSYAKEVEVPLGEPIVGDLEASEPVAYTGVGLIAPFGSNLEPIVKESGSGNGGKSGSNGSNGGK